METRGKESKKKRKKQRKRVKRQEEEAGDGQQCQTVITDDIVQLGLPGVLLIQAPTRRPNLAMGVVTKLSLLSLWSALHSVGE